MWIMQNDTLMEIPNDVPMPPNSAKVDVPEEFHKSPRDFKVQNGTLVKEPKLPFPPPPQLTLSEIERLKAFLATGVLGSDVTANSRESSRPKPGRRKEKK